MFLMLCDSPDLSAIWAHQGLRKRGLPIELITSEMLAYSLYWEHGFRADGLRTNFGLADNRKISSKNILGVVNRIQTIPSTHLRTNKADKEYALQELFAFFLSWIYSLPSPVFNRPTPQGLAGRWRHASEWVLLAHSSSLPTPIYRQSSFDEVDSTKLSGKLVHSGTPVSTVIVINEHVIGPKHLNKMKKGCLKLAELAKTPLLGIDFKKGTSKSWIFAGATPMPNLRLGGIRLLETLKNTLQAGKELYQ